MTVRVSDEELIEVCNNALNMTEAAKELGISRSTLVRKATALGCYNATNKRVKKVKPANDHERECEHPECSTIHTGEYGTGRFCSQKCSHSFCTIHARGKTKTVNCIECGTSIIIQKNASGGTAKCSTCKSKRQCKMCGDIFTVDEKYGAHSKHHICQHTNCQNGKLVPKLIENLGFDESTIGTSDYHKEFQRVVDLIREDYFDNKMSAVEMCEKYGANENYFGYLIPRLGFERRHRGEAVRNSYATGRSDPQIVSSSKYQYKSGYHTAWNGTEIYYRSSYELKYAQELDEQKVEYLVEDLRIQYWDSQTKVQRTAIPDFYLPESNMIVEIKSGWTLDLQNMKDKKESYLKHGYDFKLLVDFKEVDVII